MKTPPGIFVRHGKSGTRYQVRWRDIHGNQRGKSFAKMADAAKFSTKMRADKYSGIVGPSGFNLTFDELADAWLDSVGHHAASTAARRDGILSNYLRPAFGSVKLSHIDCHLIDKASKSWRAADLKAHTVRNHLAILNQIFSYAVKKGMLSQNPVQAADRPKLEKREIRVLSESEFEQLLGAVDPSYRLFLITAVVTGFRFSELVGLTVADLSGDILTVRAGKTANAKRSVPVSSAIAEQIRSSLPVGALPDALLFTTPTGKRIRQNNFRNRVFAPAVEAAELSGVTFHDLRRTRATMLVRAGTDPKTTQYLMGHSSIETTLRFYVDVSSEGAFEAASVGQSFVSGVSLA